MQLHKLALIALTIPLSLSLISCKEDQIPTNTPYLNKPNAQGQCAKYKMTDADTLTYAFDSWQPCSDLVGGFGLPAGQFEAVLAAVRLQMKDCQAQSEVQEK